MCCFCLRLCASGLTWRPEGLIAHLTGVRVTLRLQGERASIGTLSTGYGVAGFVVCGAPVSSMGLATAGVIWAPRSPSVAGPGAVVQDLSIPLQGAAAERVCRCKVAANPLQAVAVGCARTSEAC